MPRHCRSLAPKGVAGLGNLTPPEYDHGDADGSFLACQIPINAISIRVRFSHFRIAISGNPTSVTFSEFNISICNGILYIHIYIYIYIYKEVIFQYRKL